MVSTLRPCPPSLPFLCELSLLLAFPPKPPFLSDLLWNSAVLFPLCTANLFLLISSILGSRTAGPHTQFVQWFMEECVDCLEQDSRGSILQFMPFTTVSVPGRDRGDPPDKGGGPPPGISHPGATCVPVYPTGIRTGKGVCYVQPQSRSGHH